jgi:hypothetical protein
MCQYRLKTPQSQVRSTIELEIIDSFENSDGSSARLLAGVQRSGLDVAILHRVVDVLSFVISHLEMS